MKSQLWHEINGGFGNSFKIDMAIPVVTLQKGGGQFFTHAQWSCEKSMKMEQRQRHHSKQNGILRHSILGLICHD